jgi:hypothetical protein
MDLVVEAVVLQLLVQMHLQDLILQVELVEQEQRVQLMVHQP